MSSPESSKKVVAKKLTSANYAAVLESIGPRAQTDTSFNQHEYAALNSMLQHSSQQPQGPANCCEGGNRHAFYPSPTLSKVHLHVGSARITSGTKSESSDSMVSFNVGFRGFELGFKSQDQDTAHEENDAGNFQVIVCGDTTIWLDFTCRECGKSQQTRTGAIDKVIGLLASNPGTVALEEAERLGVEVYAFDYKNSEASDKTSTSEVSSRTTKEGVKQKVKATSASTCHRSFETSSSAPGCHGSTPSAGAAPSASMLFKKARLDDRLPLFQAQGMDLEDIQDLSESDLMELLEITQAQTRRLKKQAADLKLH